MDEDKLKALLLEALETERGGIEIYRTALECVQNEDLEEEWNEYLEQTETHEDVLLEVLETLEIDPDEMTPGREVVRHIGQSLVKAMNMALADEPEAAELVACECVVLAETKDHLNWELMSQAAKKLTGAAKLALTKACEEVENQEDEHLYHTAGWCRELHLGALGLPAVLPPPEERKDVKTAIGAARAKAQRSKMPKARRQAG